MQRRQAQVDLEAAYAQLRQWLQLEGPLEVADSLLSRMSPLLTPLGEHPTLLRLGALGDQAQQEVRVARAGWLPALQFEYFYGFGQGENARNFPGYQVGLNVPLWPNAQRAQVASSRLEVARTQQVAEDYRFRLETTQAQLQAQLRRYDEALRYYEAQALPMATEMVTMAEAAYRQGEADYLAYLQSLETAQSIRRNWLDQLHLYNQTVISLQYLQP